MAFCRKCGFEYKIDDIYCNNCGTKHVTDDYSKGKQAYSNQNRVSHEKPNTTEINEPSPINNKPDTFSHASHTLKTRVVDRPDMHPEPVDDTPVDASNLLAWILAFFPLISNLLAFAISFLAAFTMTVYEISHTSPVNLRESIAILISILFCLTLLIVLWVLDYKKINRIKKFKLGFVGLFLPVYLFKRANHCKTKKTYAYVYLALLIITTISSFIISYNDLEQFNGPTKSPISLQENLSDIDRVKQTGWKNYSNKTMEDVFDTYAPDGEWESFVDTKGNNCVLYSSRTYDILTSKEVDCEYVFIVKENGVIVDSVWYGDEYIDPILEMDMLYSDWQ